MHIRHLLLALIAAAFISCSPVEAKEYTTVSYTVVAGDTMDSIAHSYLPPDRGKSWRAFAEFKEGIFEYNFDRVFTDREPYEVRVGDCLLITFWK
ncbi:MAG: hypothetical protein H6Q69_873 [Firmicutes bacterium]|nr:hypothetical protein [Bacillota bacterium]